MAGQRLGRGLRHEVVRRIDGRAPPPQGLPVVLDRRRDLVRDEGSVVPVLVVMHHDVRVVAAHRRRVEHAAVGVDLEEVDVAGAAGLLLVDAEVDAAVADALEDGAVRAARRLDDLRVHRVVDVEGARLLRRVLRPVVLPLVVERLEVLSAAGELHDDGWENAHAALALLVAAHEHGPFAPGDELLHERDAMLLDKLARVGNERVHVLALALLGDAHGGVPTRVLHDDREPQMAALAADVLADADVREGRDLDADLVHEELHCDLVRLEVLGERAGEGLVELLERVKDFDAGAVLLFGAVDEVEEAVHGVRLVQGEPPHLAVRVLLAHLVVREAVREPRRNVVLRRAVVEVVRLRLRVGVGVRAHEHGDARAHAREAADDTDDAAARHVFRRVM
mmetsp:Transcript_13026/g.40456  ORF Transcript_13026/g.40456 Transcript_13026/m.40456 type:complete len:394 (-) Transcript_13026:88-1269(-)